MSYGDNDNFFRGLPDDNIVWKMFEDKSFSSAGVRVAGHLREWNNLIFEKIECSINRVVKFQAKAGALSLVPGCRFNSFLGSYFKYPYTAHYQSPIRSRIRT